MFDREIVKKHFPFQNILDLKKFLVHDRVQDKVRLRKFSPKIFCFGKNLKMSCLMEKF